jgi:prepilin-type N-terminal cleavage/methylation domain-containing protein
MLAAARHTRNQTRNDEVVGLIEAYRDSGDRRAIERILKLHGKILNCVVRRHAVSSGEPYEGIPARCEEAEFRVRQLKRHASWRGEQGFTLPELIIVIVLMGIVLAIASSSWFGLVESRQVDSATNQMVSDLRLAHTRATNRLANHEVRLTDNNATYRIGPSAALETRTLPDDARVDITGPTLNVVFKSDGSATPSGSSITFKVTSADGAPDHDIEINTATSRVKVVD